MRDHVSSVDRNATPLEALRRRSLRKVWWSSARIALEREKWKKLPPPSMQASGQPKRRV